MTSPDQEFKQILKVFISYAKEDQERALGYYSQLREAGFRPWLDIKHLLPGQNWEMEIERALSDSHVIILLLSKNSVSKRGFVQKEANSAIEALRRKRPDDIYILPLVIEPCDVPDYIAVRLQYTDMSRSESWDQVIKALHLAAKQQSIEISQGIPAGPFRVFTETIQEKQEGDPGYDVRIDYPRFESASSPHIATQLSALFSGRAHRICIDERIKPWKQNPERFSTSPRAIAMNWRNETFGIVHATSKFLSLAYATNYYFACAAHPNSRPETYNFLFQDGLHMLALEDFFVDHAEAVKAISEACRQALSKEFWRRNGSRPPAWQEEGFARGAGPDLSHFRAFTVGPDRFTFLFAPYQVSCYASGHWSVDVAFYDLLDHLRVDGPHILASENKANRLGGPPTLSA